MKHFGGERNTGSAMLKYATNGTNHSIISTSLQIAQKDGQLHYWRCADRVRCTR